MATWLLLFALFLVLYESGVLLWWHTAQERVRRQVVRNLASKINPEGMVRTTVLSETTSSPTRIAALFELLRFPNQFSRFHKASFMVLTLLAAAAGFILGTKFMGLLGIFAPLIGAFAVGSVPRLYRMRHRDKRLGDIEEQFPEALDFLSRSVRAGNAFSIALELLGGEAVDPLKSEIMKVTREIALGASLEDALQGLIARVPLLEIRMFVAAVLLQRETGGNLSEVLNKLANSVRDRLRLRGQVRASSGQGRLTAKVLTFMPVITMLTLKLVSPRYLDALTNDPIGPNLIGAAAVSQIIGYLVMQNMIRVEV